MRILALVLALAAAPASALADALPRGDFDGVLRVGPNALRLTLHFGDKVTLDSPDQGGFCLPSTASAQGGLLTVQSASGISLTGPLTDNLFAATLTQGPAKLPVAFTRRPPHTPPPQPSDLAPDEHEVSLGDRCQPLFATYRTTRPGPAVLLLPGSGPTDRDGNSSLPGVRPASLRLLAEGLAARGYASLRVDKRGIGMSRMAMTSEAELRFPQYIDDAIAWTRWLKAQPGVTCVVLAGHSEGALIAAMAAHKVAVCGVISLSGSGETMGALLRKQARNNGLTGERLANFDQVLVKLEHGQLVPDVPVSDPVLRPSVQPYAISQINIDPAAQLKGVRAPVLIVHGDNDLLVDVDNAARLAAARPDAKVVILPGMTHMLKNGPRDVAGQNAVRANPSIPLSPGLIDAMASFLAAVRP